MRRFKLDILLIHISLIAVVTGGLLTWLTGEKGELALSPGEVRSEYVVIPSGELHKLPVSVRLDSFVVDYYPGRALPRDFRSHLSLGSGGSVIVAMNRIGHVGGYRLTQLSYSDDGSTLLAVSHDPWGIGVTYLGYVLFAIGGLAWIVRISQRIIPIVLFMTVCCGSGAAAAPKAVSPEYASGKAFEPVVYSGRVVPLSTVATDFTLKLTGKTSFLGLSPERFMISVLMYPQEWNDIAFLRVSEEPLRAELGISGDYIAPSALIDPRSGEYILASIHASGNKAMQAAVERLDEKTELLVRLREGTLFSPPDVADNTRSRFSLQAETFLNRIAPGRWIYIPILAWGILLLFVGNKRIGLWRPLVTGLLFIAAAVTWGVRWWLQEHVPLVGGYEVMLFSSVVLLGISLVAFRKSSMLPIGVICAGFTALVARISGSNPVMTTLIPVLASPWLSAHVALVMTSYCLLGLTFPVSFFSRMRPTLYFLNASGVVILGLGIISGAVWANLSWGRYWGWDPKETCALVTFLVYALPLHSRLRFATSPLYYLLGLLAIIFTYIGPSFLGPSLHTY